MKLLELDATAEAQANGNRSFVECLPNCKNWLMTGTEAVAAALLAV